MTLLVPQSQGIPIGEPTPLSLPFWDACADGVLLYLHCGVCSVAQFPPSPICRVCGEDDLEWRKSRGLASVYSWTVVWQPPAPSFVVPYAPAIVDFDEGFQFLTNIVGCAPEDITLGMRVEVLFISVGAPTLPYVVPTS
jgi:uncharacterized protein